MQSTFIQLEDLRVDCLIGVWSHERNKTQQIRVDLTVEFDGQSAALEDALEATLNYADVSRDVAFILESGQFKLLESATWMLQQWLLAPPAAEELGHNIRSVEVQLTKFGALTGSTLATVRSPRQSSNIQYAQETRGYCRYHWEPSDLDSMPKCRPSDPSEALPRDHARRRTDSLRWPRLHY